MEDFKDWRIPEFRADGYLPAGRAFAKVVILRELQRPKDLAACGLEAVSIPSAQLAVAPKVQVPAGDHRRY
jgi:hypothetical protein